MKVAVVGCGYVGLATAATLAYLGHEVVGLDRNAAHIGSLQEGRLPLHEPGLQKLLASVGTRLTFTTDAATALSPADLVILCVGTPAAPDGRADLGDLRAATLEVARHIAPQGVVVVNKSTAPVGSGNWVGALLEDGLRARNFDRFSFSVASNPEFLREGSALQDTFYPDRIVLGADDERTVERLYRLYRPILEQSFTPPVHLPRPEEAKPVPLVAVSLAAAELIKYASSAFLAMKVSFINDIARLAHSLDEDVEQVARGIGLDHRIGTSFLRPGLGWGGSCFSKDTSGLLALASDQGLELPTVRAARDSNALQGEWVKSSLVREMRILKGRTVGILGLAFKPETDDIRDAPALELISWLLSAGAKVRAHDPQAMERAKAYFGPVEGLDFCDDPEQVAQGAGCLVLVTEWATYSGLDYRALLKTMRRPLLFDLRNALDPQALRQMGYWYHGVGRVSQRREQVDKLLREVVPDSPIGRAEVTAPEPAAPIVLVTGAAGFLGSHLVDYLLEQGNQVLGLDNLITGRAQNLQHLQGHPRFRFLVQDVARPMELSLPLSRIYHMASPASPPRYLENPFETMRANTRGTENLLELARTKGARLLFASTSEIYGDPQIHPQTESYWGNVNPNGPRSVYDEAKRYGETLLKAYERYHGVQVRVARIFNTYGPRMCPNDGRLVTNLGYQALRGQPMTIYGQGKQTRSLQFVDDLMRGLVALMESDYTDPINLGNPEEYSILELARMIIEITDSKSELRFEPLPQDDPCRRRPDISVARQVLGWEPRIPVREGLQRTLSDFRGLLAGQGSGETAHPAARPS